MIQFEEHKLELCLIEVEEGQHHTVIHIVRKLEKGKTKGDGETEEERR